MCPRGRAKQLAESLAVTRVEAEAEAEGGAGKGGVESAVTLTKAVLIPSPPPPCPLPGEVQGVCRTATAAMGAAGRALKACRVLAGAECEVDALGSRCAPG